MLYESFNLKLDRLYLGCMMQSFKLGEKLKIYICEIICKITLILQIAFISYTLNSIQIILFFNTIDQ